MIINTIYFSGAVLFLLVAMDALRCRPELRSKNKVVIASAVAIWIVFWPVSCAVVANDLIDNANRRKT